MIVKKNILKVFILFLLSHLFLWTLIPSVSNENLPLDTIEALAWSSNLNWGYDKHPPFSAFAVEVIYTFFGSNDWAFYLLSQIFVITAFFYVWRLSNEIFKEKIFALISLLILEGVFFYNFTTPEFNVNVSQLPFWALTVYFFWKGINKNKTSDWILFGFFSALGFLSKYLFIYILFSLFLFFFINIKENKSKLKNYILSIFVSFIILVPHFFWLTNNNFKTIFYGLERASSNDLGLVSHLLNPLNFILKQFLILVPVFIMLLILLKKFKLKINFNDKKFLFLFSVSALPFLLVVITSILTGVYIRTMWMTPFYLFIGIFLIEVFRKNIDLKKINRFFGAFLFFFLLPLSTYFAVSFYDDTKRTDYPGKEISRLVQDKWDDNFSNEIRIVVGDEWSAGNLSYHLRSRPVWINNLKNRALNIQDHEGVIYTGNPKILKKVCPGVFGTIKPVGYCMIGKR